jgi:hypothetical protein
MGLFDGFSTALTRARPRAPRRSDWLFLPRLLCLEDRLVLDAVSAGPNGIDARGLQSATGAILSGTNISIGQVETGRPGLQAIGDNVALTHPHVVPQGVFLRNAAAVPNQDIDSHAIEVAGVMVANAGAHLGVAPSARLFASASPDAADVETDMRNSVVSMQHVALQNPLGNDPRGTVRAINLSFTYPADPQFSVRWNLDHHSGT